MDEIRGEILEKINRFKKQEKERRKHENIHLISSEKDFFKDEAIRLNLICKTLSQRNEELMKENKICLSEIENLSKKWKESENINKQLLIELERNIDKNLEYEKEISGLKQQAVIPQQKQSMNADMYFNKEKHFQQSDQANLSNLNMEERDRDVLINYDNQNIEMSKEKAVDLINQMKQVHKREKTRYIALIKELNQKISQPSNLEARLKDCFAVVSTEIRKRKLLAGLEAKNRKSANTKLVEESPPKTFYNNFNEFTAKDKERLLEKFLLNDEVINIIHEHAFNGMGQSSTAGTSNNNMNTGFSFPTSNFNKTGFSNTRSIFQSTAGKNMTGFKHNSGNMNIFSRQMNWVGKDKMSRTIFQFNTKSNSQPKSTN